MASSRWISVPLFSLILSNAATAEDLESMLNALEPSLKTWVEDSCPRIIGPSLWASCVSRELTALSEGLPTYEGLSEADKAWIAESCPRAVGPALQIPCVEREKSAIQAGIPDLSSLSADQRRWIQESCPRAVGPSLYRTCLNRELQALRAMSTEPEPAAGSSLAPRGPTGADATKPGTAPSDPGVLNAQIVLSALGFYHGSLDGSPGPATRSALKDFQRRANLPATGILDDPTSTLLATLVQRAASQSTAATSSDCTGYNSTTSSQVYGECDDGDFSGYDSTTGNWIWGDCESGGDLSAWDSSTGAWIYGDCD